MTEKKLYIHDRYFKNNLTKKSVISPYLNLILQGLLSLSRITALKSFMWNLSLLENCFVAHDFRKVVMLCAHLEALI